MKIYVRLALLLDAYHVLQSLLALLVIKIWTTLSMITLYVLYAHLKDAFLVLLLQNVKLVTMLEIISFQEQQTNASYALYKVAWNAKHQQPVKDAIRIFITSKMLKIHALFVAFKDVQLAKIFKIVKHAIKQEIISPMIKVHALLANY